ncbi:DUF1329 domain-containing protein [Pseudomonas sp. LB3P14]
MKMFKPMAALGMALFWSGLVSPAIGASGTLGKDLTPFGAEVAGNADGSIPAYQGNGIKNIPADFVPGSGRYPNPFKGEKPLYSVTAQNMGQYQNLLGEGVKELFKRFPDYRMDVYQSHRTMQYPGWVLKNSLDNAGKAKLVGDEPGDGLEGAYGAIPFPKPENGLEVLWNQAMRYQGPRIDMRFNTFFVDRNGTKTMVGDQETQFMWAYYDPKSTSVDTWNYLTGVTKYFGPPAQVGQVFLQKWTTNNTLKDDTTWVYTPGQRRVRVAPELKYDTPAAAIGGVLSFEELGGFNGRKDRFDWKLIGKQEMLIPYNSYSALFDTGLLGDKHENPDLMRWEKHRVWVVEGTLRPGKRHIYSKRLMYFDEDSWQQVGAVGYDHSNEVYRVMNNTSAFLYDMPRLAQPSQFVYDLTKGSWAATAYLADPRTHQIPYDELPQQSRFTPETMAGQGLR